MQSHSYVAFASHAKVLSLIVSMAAVGLGAVATVVTRRVSSKSVERRASNARRDAAQLRLEPTQSHTHSPEEKAAPLIRRITENLQDASETLDDQIKLKETSRFSSNSLTIGQVIIGGLLTSSFLTTFMGGKVTGTLGVLVLLSSLIKESFHPEIEAAIAKKKADQLESLLLDCKNELAILETKIKNSEDQSDALIRLLRDTSARLNAIKMQDAIKPGDPNHGAVTDSHQTTP